MSLQTLALVLDLQYQVCVFSHGVSLKSNQKAVGNIYIETHGYKSCHTSVHYTSLGSQLGKTIDVSPLHQQPGSHLKGLWKLTIKEIAS